MAEKLDPKQMVTAEELLITNVIQVDAITNLLLQKGLLEKDELMQEILRLREERFGR